MRAADRRVRCLELALEMHKLVWSTRVADAGVDVEYSGETAADTVVADAQEFYDFVSAA